MNNGVESNTSNRQQEVERKNSVLLSHGYKLAQTIGSGSYAIIKLAYSENHRSNVAIKIISKKQKSARYLEKFLPREIEVVKGLKHENIIKYYESILTTHRVFIIMEYAENGCLTDILRRDGRIDENRARKWFFQLVNAIEYCHMKGVVHRDIKCENMLMDIHYNVKLMDFGFARFDMLKKNGQIKTSNTFCGTPAYVAPEILRGLPYQPDKSDVWSSGVVLYKMIFGTLPFGNKDLNKLILRVQEPLQFPYDVNSSEECRHLIHKILTPVKYRIYISKIKTHPWLARISAAHENDKTDIKPVRLKTNSKKLQKEENNVAN